MRTKALFIIVTLFFVSNQSTFTQECDYFADFIDKYPTTCLAFVENPEGNHGDYVRLKIWGKGGFEPIKDRYEFHVFCFDLKKKKRYAYSRLSPLENRELRRYRDGSKSLKGDLVANFPTDFDNIKQKKLSQIQDSDFLVIFCVEGKVVDQAILFNIRGGKLGLIDVYGAMRTSRVKYIDDAANMLEDLGFNK